MHFDFAAILVGLTFLTGVIWAIDHWFFARRRAAEMPPGEAPREPVLVEYSRSFFPVILIVLLFRSFLAEPFRIPSGSMMPTLLVGDFILVNKFAYGIRLPVLDKKIIEIGAPERGDVVVFRFPKDPAQDYIKRVIGKPGDDVTYRNKKLYINGKEMPQENRGAYAGTDAESRELARGRLGRTLRYRFRPGIISSWGTTGIAVRTAASGASCPRKISSARPS